ncbi:MAG: ATP-binding protein [Polyangiaceae bacterium]
MGRNRENLRSSTRWSEPPSADPHRDVTGALHDVSNALTVLLGWVAEAREGSPSPEQLAHALAIIDDRARAARDLARRAIGAHEAIDQREESLDAVVGEVVDSLSVEAQRGGVKLAVSRRCPGLRIPLAADASQVLTNVLLNALAWAPPGTRVTVEPREDDASASIVVEDEGPGVSPDKAATVFDGVTSRDEGAGVGLKYARAMSRAAGGDLELLPDGERPGARFLVRWPRLEPMLPNPASSSLRARVLAGKRVLIVEDDADVAALLEAGLGARGASVVVVRTAAELFRRAGERHDAALVDLSPIAHDIHGAIAALRQGSPEVMLVLISGSAVGLPEGLEGQRIQWVRKPFEVGEIVAALSEVDESK